ncbi:MAG: tRNA glutamyl-Q(34) synthetase GluQRS [Planctomycetes bacterium]|nr:tRNA glutamyl-Q(34) synthetase GluQRS [Planctomycetota bacterium]
MQIVGRLAPSPTGHLHLGHARSFLVAWWHARARGGRVVLRIEDLDVERVKPGMLDETLRDLEWLGLDWDGSPWIQSAGLSRIQAAADELVARGLAYPCVCTRREIEAAQSAPHAGEAGERYPGTCRGRFDSVEAAEHESGRKAALRFVVQAGVVEFEDGVLGAQAFDVDATVGDFPILRRAGFPAYQLAVVVDDARQGVSEIVRGADLVDSTARQVLLQRALGYARPRWWHIPLVVDAAGRRFAKRSDDIALARLRALGVAPESLVAWVARRSGIPFAEPASARDFAPEFDMQRLPQAPVIATPAALRELHPAL